jgi:hypothetical protein
MNSLPILLTLPSLFALTAAAQADWQYTKWGMTKDQVIAASKGEARSLRPGDDFVCAYTGQNVMAIVPAKQIAGERFNVSFCTTGNGRLTNVALRSSAANFATMKRALISQYGAPLSDSRSGTIWNDKKTGNTITLADVAGVAVSIEYKPIGDTGL